MGDANRHGARLGILRDPRSGNVAHNLYVLSIGLAAGSALQLPLILPPLWPFAAVALALPVVVCLRRNFPAAWLLCGLGFSASFAGVLVLGLAKFGLLSAVVLVAISMLSVGGPWFLAAVVAARRSAEAAALALPGLWALWIWLADQLYAPVLVFAPLALAMPDLAESAALYGVPTWEALLVAVSVAIALLLSGARRNALLYLLAGGLSLAIPALTASDTDEKVATKATLRILTPQHDWRRLAQAGWSVDARKTNERRLDDLVAAAVADGVTLVAPENGNGLLNAQIPRRRAILTSALREHHSDLILPSEEWRDGERLLSAFLVTQRGFSQRTQKSRVVPVIERDLTRGAAIPLDSINGRVGVGLCFDSMFGRFFRETTENGAEFYVVAAEASSFGHSIVSAWHGAHSILWAMEIGRSVVFAANGGDAYFFDVADLSVVRLSVSSGTRFLDVRASRSSVVVPAMAGWRNVFPMIGLVFFAIITFASRARCCARWLPPLNLRVILLGLLRLSLTACYALVLSFCVTLAYSAIHRRVSIAEVVRDVARRTREGPAADAIGPVFRQTQQVTCGPAALAFALYILGDDVFEEDVRPRVDLHADGTYMASLHNYAISRGFEAATLSASSIDALSLGPFRLAIALLENRHYVVLWQPIDDDIHLFDPAAGRVLRVGEADVEAIWSGRVLLLEPSPVVLTHA